MLSYRERVNRETPRDDDDPRFPKVRASYVVKYRNEDGNWYMTWRGDYCDDIREARRFYVKRYADKIAALEDARMTSNEIRSRIHTFLVMEHLNARR